MVWVLDYLDDLEADFRVFYRMDTVEILELGGPHFLALAHRTTAYAGVLQARMMAEQEKGQQAASKGTDGFVESTPAALQHDAALSDLIDYG